jgi:hypothetical protein
VRARGAREALFKACWLAPCGSWPHRCCAPASQDAELAANARDAVAAAAEHLEARRTAEMLLSLVRLQGTSVYIAFFYTVLFPCFGTVGLHGVARVAA